MSRLAVVPGDPTGIGPEVTLKALIQTSSDELIVIGDHETWEETQRTAGTTLPALPATEPGPISQEGVPFLAPDLTDRSWKIGEVSSVAGAAVATWLEHAVQMAIRGIVDGVVFAPLNKQALMRAGFEVHDEYDLIAAVAKVESHQEMNVIPHPAGSGLLWVTRVTSHVPFREVHGRLTTETILEIIRSAHRFASTVSSTVPEIGVAALNPHAGEGGLLGDEEARIIRPAIDTARSQGIQVSGPHPADQVFRLAQSGRLHVVVCLYHDQSQIALKLMDFERAVTVGAGYPFVLTTPAHGTAYDIVGQGTADPGPMIQGLVLAEKLVVGTRDR
jgi:4-hydroxythreonine-4-phosphate dehydrogenase